MAVLPRRIVRRSFHTGNSDTTTNILRIEAHRDIKCVAIAADSEVDMVDLYPVDIEPSQANLQHRRRVTAQRPWFGTSTAGDRFTVVPVRRYPTNGNGTLTGPLDAGQTGTSDIGDPQHSPQLALEIYYDGEDVPEHLERADSDVENADVSATSGSYWFPTQGRTRLSITMSYGGGANSVTFTVYGVTATSDVDEFTLLATHTIPVDGDAVSDDYEGSQFDAINVRFSSAGAANPTVRVIGSEK